MRCLNPRYITAVSADPKRSGKLQDDFTVPCGRCMACRINKTREWAIRLAHEQLYWEKSSFVTLTYKEVPKIETTSQTIEIGVNKRDPQLWIKRLRKELQGKKIKYYLASEYGEERGRPHYHAILFGVGYGDEDGKLIADTWGLGQVKVGSVTYQSCRYVSQYIQKKMYGEEKMLEEYGLKAQPFSLMSKGLGLRFAQDHQDAIYKNFYVTKNGKNAGLPRYYRKKLEIDSIDLQDRYKEVNEEIENEMKDRTQQLYTVEELAEAIIEEKDLPERKRYFPEVAEFKREQFENQQRRLYKKITLKKDKF